MSDPVKTSPSDEFAPPWVELLPDGTELRFVPFDIEHFAETCAGLNLQRERSEKTKLDANPSLLPQQRESLLQAVRRDPFGISYAMWYRREEPTGIKVGLRKALLASWGDGAGKTPDERKAADAKADGFVRRLKPRIQHQIASYLVDPYPLADPGTPDPKTGAPESTSTESTGPEGDSSSNEPSPESTPDV